jgi:hypothetical protein
MPAGSRIELRADLNMERRDPRNELNLLETD